MSIKPGDVVYFKECRDGCKHWKLLEIQEDRALCKNMNPRITLEHLIPLCSLKIEEVDV